MSKRLINVINADLCGNKDLHIVFNELFDVTFMGDEPFVKTTVIWENFYQINKLKNGYYISVKIDKTTLLTFYRKLFARNKKMLYICTHQITI